MSETTLADRVIRNFSIIKIKKCTVKVPKLKAGKGKIGFKKGKTFLKKDSKAPISSVISILIKAAVENARKEEKCAAEKNKIYEMLKEDKKLNANGGYGSASKSYETAPHASYVDYGKIFGYLGKFRANSPYENFEGRNGGNGTISSGKSALIDSDAIEKGSRYVKYFARGSQIDATSLVPVAGMSSSEWEQFKLWMKLDPVMYRLKTSTS